MARRRPTASSSFAFSDAHGTSEVAGRARGQEEQFSSFAQVMNRQLWKTGPKLITARGHRTWLHCSSAQGRYNGPVTVIREFRPEDFETLWRMDQECFPAGISYSKPELRAYIRSRGTFTLVGAQQPRGETIGFIVAHAATTGHIITIDVAPAARRTGVGSVLLCAAEERLIAAGAHAVGLETAVDNLSALSFYKRHGYSVIRTWPRYYSNGVDALVMKKKLSDSASEQG